MADVSDELSSRPTLWSDSATVTPLAKAALNRSNAKVRIIKALSDRYPNGAQRMTRDDFVELVAAAAEDDLATPSEVRDAAWALFGHFSRQSLDDGRSGAVSVRQVISYFRFGFCAASGVPKPIGLPASLDRRTLNPQMKGAANIYELGLPIRVQPTSACGSVHRTAASRTSHDAEAPGAISLPALGPAAATAVAPASCGRGDGAASMRNSLSLPSLATRGRVGAADDAPARAPPARETARLLNARLARLKGERTPHAASSLPLPLYLLLPW